MGQIVALLAPYVDRLEQLPERASPIFNYDAKAALAAPDNAEVLSWPNTDAVFARFAVKIMADESASTGQLTPEQFKKIVNEVKAETGVKGKELFHPIRVVITGSHSGPDFDRLIPILEAGSHLTSAKARTKRPRASRRIRQSANRIRKVSHGSTPDLRTTRNIRLIEIRGRFLLLQDVF